MPLANELEASRFPLVCSPRHPRQKDWREHRLIHSRCVRHGVYLCYCHVFDATAREAESEAGARSLGPMDTDGVGEFDPWRRLSRESELGASRPAELQILIDYRHEAFRDHCYPATAGNYLQHTATPDV